jgi:guanine nucleotide-binding protein subunit alpha
MFNWILLFISSSLINPRPSLRSELMTDANGMVEALVLWESVANSNWFAKSSMILFLNKADVFSAKIRDPQQQIHSTFPDYNGKPGNYQDGVHYFKKRFEGLSKGQKEVYVHVTTAVRTFKIVSRLIK